MSINPVKAIELESMLVFIGRCSHMCFCTWLMMYVNTCALLLCIVSDIAGVRRGHCNTGMAVQLLKQLLVQQKIKLWP